MFGSVPPTLAPTLAPTSPTLKACNRWKWSLSPSLLRKVVRAACACTLSIRSQLRAGGGKLSLASLAVLAFASHTAVGAD